MAQTPQLILVIDDDPDLVETLTDSLELQGNYRVMSASDGIQGLLCAAETRPDCIVVDVRMPQLNGLQFAQALRGDPATALIPIIMMSALVQDRDLMRGLFSGADAYLRKPVRLEELLKVIKQSLHLSMEQRARRWRELAEDTPAPEKDSNDAN